MTDNEIMRALKSEIRIAEYVDNDFADNVSIALLKDTLDLINRQKAEIERLQKEVGLVSIQFQDMQERQEESQAEIERLEKEVEDKEKTYNDEFCLRKEWQSKCRELLKDKQTTKSEAIKEFAARLKNKIKTECNPYGKPTFDYDTSISIMYYIDNLVKEMVGENNG